MRIHRLILPVLCAGVMLAQTPPPVPAPTAPPPGTEEALRARVRTFYQGYVDQKLRKTYDTVGDDSKEYFLAAPKAQYRGFEIQKVEFSSDYMTAVVTTLVQSSLPIFGILPPGSPEQSHWEQVDGQWYWYVPPPAPGEANLSPQQRVIMSMFNIPVPKGAAAGQMAAPAGAVPAPVPGAGAAAAPAGVSPMAMPGLMPGMPPMMGGMPGGLSGMMPPGMPGGMPGGLPGMSNASAQSKADLRKEITLERDSVDLSVKEPGHALVNLRNASGAGQHFALIVEPVPGLDVSAAQTALTPGGQIPIRISWTPPAGAAGSLPPTIVVRVTLVPSGLVLPLNINFHK